MAGFDDLVAEAMPYMAVEHIMGARGSSWEWSYELRDTAGALVDWTGVTGVCELRSAIGGGVVLAPTVALPSAGIIKITATPTQTGGVTAGTYLHEVELTNAAGRKVKVVGSGDSRFIVKAEVTS